MSEKFHKVIGIDLGTTYSAVAAYDKDKLESKIINNQSDGDKATTPSVVSLDPMLNKVIVGEAAKRNLAIKPENTIIEIKREMGELFTPESLKKYGLEGVFKPEDPFQVKFNVPWLSAQERWFSPQEISAFILMKMKEIAEVEIGEDIRDAVVTVPAYFTEKQKKATEEAALMAGLYPLQLIAEPTAAAICYGLDKLESGKKTYLVYDLGGGTFDVSIIEVEEENIRVIATTGDSRLGGSDFDDAIMDWAAKELLEKHNRDIRNDRPSRAYVKSRAESAKILLSTLEQTTMELAFGDSRTIYQLELTRSIFEQLIDGHLRRSLNEVDRAIQMASEQKDVKREHIDAILLVGGSTKIPKARAMLLDYFGKDENFVRSEINPDAVVARGAAIMASRFAPTPHDFDISRRNENVLITDDSAAQIGTWFITEHSLGVEIQDHRIERIVNVGTNIPIEIKKDGFVNQGPTTEIVVNVYQGEGSYTYENTLIGSLHIGPMEPKPRGEHHFEVAFKLDENGLLTMVVNHLTEDKLYEARFEQKTGVGGEDALKAKSSKLFKLFAHRAAAVPSRAETVVPPPHSPQPPPSAPDGQPTVESDESAPSPGTADTETSPPDAPPPPSEQTGGEDQAAIPGLIEPQKEIPAQFKQMVRRGKKQLLKKFDQRLLDAFNAFSSALNAGQTEEEVEDIGDNLADVFDEIKQG